MPTQPFSFAVAVPDSGYRWWYVDGVSDDGQYGVVIIAFVGSVFSPYYFRARQRGPTPAAEHCAINVCLYRPGGHRWAMTERSSRSMQRDTHFFSVARSRLEWQNGRLVISVDERTTPFARRLTGSIELSPQVINDREFSLDPGRRHRWRPVSPVADIEVAFDRPDMRWRGHGYLDTNAGDRMLELDFTTWDWSRQTQGECTTIYYVANHLDGGSEALGLRIDPVTGVAAVPVPPAQALPKGIWRVDRVARSEVPLELARSFEDTPFYTRSLLASRTDPAQLLVHETLDMRRFRTRWVQTLLPFRMPRFR